MININVTEVQAIEAAQFIIDLVQAGESPEGRERVATQLNIHPDMYNDMRNLVDRIKAND